MVVTGAASPSSASPEKTRKLNHPPYNKMIIEAILSLKDRNGSSRSAISDFITGAYADLPQNHEALLSTHIRRLRSSGEIAMIKHSYVLPTSSSPPPQLPIHRPSPDSPEILDSLRSDPIPARAGRGPEDLVPRTAVSEKRRPGRPPSAAAAALMKLRGTGPRRRGRPRKNPVAGDTTPPSVILLPKPSGPGRRDHPVHAAANVLFVMRRPGKHQAAAPGPFPAGNSGTERRKMGRPRKIAAVDTGAAAANVLFGMDPARAEKRGRPKGRPRKIAAADTRNAGTEKGTEKRKRGWKKGRPRKLTSMNAVVSAGRKKLGRPRKVLSSPLPSVTVAGSEVASPDPLQQLAGIALAEAERGGFSPTPLPVEPLEGKKRVGRPRKIAMDDNYTSMNTVLPKKLDIGVGAVEKRRPGRPRKVPVNMPVEKMKLDGPKRVPMKVFGVKKKRGWRKKLGRPKMLPITSPFSRSTDENPTLNPPAMDGNPVSLIPMQQSAESSIALVPEFARSGSPREVVPAKISAEKSEPDQPANISTEKRRRGRPKKVLMDISAEKKKPGRPKKLSWESPLMSTLVGNTSVNPVIIDGNYMVSPEVQPSAEPDPGSAPESVNISVEKRSPGRPRKVPKKISVEKMKPGHNTSVNPVIIDGNSMVSPEVQPSAESDPGSAPESVNISVEKRSPGRPRKVPKKISVEKKKPGRPRKLPLNSTSAPTVVDNLAPVVDDNVPVSKMVMDGNSGNSTPLNPLQPLVKPNLGLVPESVIISSEKRKPGRPRKAYQSISGDKRNSGQPIKLPLNSPSALIVGKNAPVDPLVVGGNDTSVDLVEPSVEKTRSGRPKKAPEKLSPAGKRKLDAPRKLPTNTLAPTLYGNASLNPLGVDDNHTSMNSLQQSVVPGLGVTPEHVNIPHDKTKLGRARKVPAEMSSEKRRPGRPRKVALNSPSAPSVVGNASPLSVELPLSVEPGHVPVEKKRPGRPKKVPLNSPLAPAKDNRNVSLNPEQVSSWKTTTCMGLGPEPMPHNATSSNQVHSSTGKVTGGVEHGNAPMTATVGTLIELDLASSVLGKACPTSQNKQLNSTWKSGENNGLGGQEHSC